MGNLQNGLFGGFVGRVGNLVGYMLNGKNVIRTIGHTGKPLSPARKINCDRMKIINGFLQPIIPFLKLGFKLKVHGTDRNYYNEAVSYNKKHAVAGEYPNATMDYSKAKISMGSLLKAENPQIQVLDTEIEFSWDVPAELSWRNRTDRAMVLLCFPGHSDARYCLSGAQRQEGKHRIPIPLYLLNERIEAYISFINDDGSEISDSVYAGSIAKKEALPEEKAIDSADNQEPIVAQGIKTSRKRSAQAKTSSKTILQSKNKVKLRSKLPSFPETISLSPDHPDPDISESD
ncbi:DUF6266 family protein [Pedobacter gandavensis]|uniref:DUF6266 family protein n=1 Tax=Pedobacter gandavensis TaxID=2679963 RepID=UPI00292E2664|nr:DUF6266 family protein [Pedobacter gandavensis]